MKVFFRLFLLAAITYGLPGCNAREKQVQVRILTLDTVLAESRPHIEGVFSAMEELHKAVSPGPPADALHRIAEQDTLALFRMVMNYQKMLTTRGRMEDLEPTLSLDSNTITFFLNPDINPAKHIDLADQLRYVNVEDIRYALRRMQGRDWPYFISEPEEWRDEENRDKMMADVKASIQRFDKYRYIIGVEEKLLLAGKMITRQRFNTRKI
ncbi:MAG: hypothetical protein WD077_02145 [Bacteroidia bacterium]